MKVKEFKGKDVRRAYKNVSEYHSFCKQHDKIINKLSSVGVYTEEVAIVAYLTWKGVL